MPDLSACSLGYNRFNVSKFNVGCIDGSISVIGLSHMLLNIDPPWCMFSMQIASCDDRCFLSKVTNITLLSSFPHLTDASPSSGLIGGLHFLIPIHFPFSFSCVIPYFLAIFSLCIHLCSPPRQSLPPPAPSLCREARHCRANPCWIPTTQVHTHVIFKDVCRTLSTVGASFFFFVNIKVTAVWERLFYL